MRKEIDGKDVELVLCELADDSWMLISFTEKDPEQKEN